MVTCASWSATRAESASSANGLTITGPGGHSWSDHGAGNPVHALSRAVALFSDIKLNGGPRSSFNVGTFEGGTSINAIPPLARAKVDMNAPAPRARECLPTSSC